MNVADAFAAILKIEGTEFLACYPRNPLIEACARADIRPIICRQERVGVGIADGFSRAAARGQVGVFAAQSGPGIENSYPGVAQAFADNVPLLVIPTGPGLERPASKPSYYPADALADVSKWTVRLQRAADVPMVMRRAYQLLRTEKSGPVVIEVPADLWDAPFPGELKYEAVKGYRAGPDQADVDLAADKLLAAKNPVIWAGQGVLWAEATPELVALAELLGAPVMTTNPGKSAFPENHPLSLGGSAVNSPKPMTAALNASDVVLAIGSSLSTTPFNPQLPRTGSRFVIQSSNSAYDINKDVAVNHAILGDAKLVMAALHAAVSAKSAGKGRPGADKVPAATQAAKKAWLDSWKPQLESNEKPINPYRVINDLLQTLDMDNTIVTHDAGSPREHILPFWESTQPRGYIGWGKTTQLGHGLGCIMGAKLAAPEKVCINWMGDAAFCMVGLDLDTAARNRIPIITIVINNGVMACERDQLVVSREKFDAFDIGGDYASIATALGVHAQKVTEPEDFIPALKRAVAMTESGQPSFLEVITKQCYDFAAD